MSANTMLFTLCLAASVIIVAAEPQSQGIDWQPCTELKETFEMHMPGTDCGHVTVPLDYTDKNSPPLELDVFRVVATEGPVLGSVLINFGGPGQTAAQNLPTLAKTMAETIGTQWDLVSWDPRGTGQTIPFDCGPGPDTDSLEAHAKRDSSLLPTGNLTRFYLDYGWDFAGLVADHCYESMSETGQFIGTTFVARDMMEIVNALGEDGMLRYWGTSYGSVLGAHAAAMFPEKVDRMVLDANVNLHDYRAGHWGDFAKNSEKAFSAFLTECLASKDSCDLAQYTNAKNIDDMLKPISALIEPLAADSNSSFYAWSDLRFSTSALFHSLYNPAYWRPLASAIAEVLNGTRDTFDWREDWAIYGIRASDAIGRAANKTEYLSQVSKQEKTGSFKATYTEIWFNARWKMDAKEQYAGDFTAKTRNPILFVNGQHDPVTPIESAYNSSAGFEGSFVLPHTGFGHGMLANPSECVTRHVQEYFKEGKLPEEGTSCEPDHRPWDIIDVPRPPAEDETSSSSSGSLASLCSTSSTSVIIIVALLVNTYI
ncbi:hypothetical protein Q7P37_008426 [Cladosporium fusiforme]